MSYGIVDYSNQIPPHSIKHIPAASSIHNYASEMGAYHQNHQYHDYQNGSSPQRYLDHQMQPNSVYNDNNSFSFSNSHHNHPQHNSSFHQNSIPQERDQHPHSIPINETNWSSDINTNKMDNNNNNSNFRMKPLQPFFNDSNPVPISSSPPSSRQTKTSKGRKPKVCSFFFKFIIPNLIFFLFF